MSAFLTLSGEERTSLGHRKIDGSDPVQICAAEIIFAKSRL
jgi:hypothetical protein